MALTRRQFLTLMGGSAGAAVLFQACGLPEKELLIDSPPAMPEDLVSGIDNWYATTNQQGGSSEGIVVRVMEGRAKKWKEIQTIHLTSVGIAPFLKRPFKDSIIQTV